MTRSLITLAVGLVALTVLGWVFGETTEAVLKQDDIAALDSPVTRWLAANRVPWLTRTMQVVTELGSAWFVIALLTVVTAGLAWRRATRWLAWVPAVSAAGAALLVFAIKLAIARPRPEIGEIVAVAGGFSFPSGHSASRRCPDGRPRWSAPLPPRRAPRGPRPSATGP